MSTASEADAGLHPDTAIAELVASRRDVGCIPASAAASHAAFREWMTSTDGPETGRWTFVDGEVIVDMSPEYFDAHADVKGEVYAVFRALGRETGLGRAFCDGCLISNVEAGVSNEPDALFVTWESIRTGRVRLSPGSRRPSDSNELVGTPDVVVEVLSDSSEQKDERLLRVAYFAAGIPEYWLLDARSDDSLRFELLRRGVDGYEPTPIVDGWADSRVFGRRFRLVRERDPIGRWHYTLEHEPIEAA